MTSESATEDAALVRRSRTGDTEAFTQLVRKYENLAYATALNCVHRIADAEDIVQEAFIAAYCKLVQLRAPERFGSWLRAIVHTRAMEWIRRQRTIPISACTMDTAQVGLAQVSARRYASERQNADLWDAVYALPEKYREVVLMYYLNDFSYKQIADFVGLPVSTVKGRLQQSRIKLRAELSPIETEEWIMSRAHVEKKVEEAICAIVREEIQQTIPLGDTDHIVLFCGVDADIEICRTDGDDVVLTGAKTSIGFSEEDARASVAGIQVLSDQVENFLKTGPHPGEIFTGTWHDKQGHPIGRKSVIGGQWNGVEDAVAHKHSAFTDLYPDISAREEGLFQIMNTALHKAATRITVIREHMEDIVIPRRAYTEAVQRVFTPNYTDNDQVHGPIGRVDLVLALPARKRITVLSGKHIRLGGLRSDVNILNGNNVELSDIEGDVCLLDTSVRKAQGIRGRFLQSCYKHEGMDSSNYQGRRTSILDSVLQDITGEIYVDLAGINLEISNLNGKVDIRNRFGTTRFHLNTHETGSTYRIESDSGEVLVLLKENLIGEMNLTVNTICGIIKYDPLKILGKLHTANDRLVMTISTITSPPPEDNITPEVLDADLYVKTRDGDVTIEKTM
jgi:RNA polymerase sigma-70 factor (ECF subfamily)